MDSCKNYIAHKNLQGETQGLKEHSEKTAELSREYAIDELKEIAYVNGLMHDIGKYQPSFQERINGNDNIQIEHAFCGAKVIRELYDNIVGQIGAFCISGHHTGLPDGGVVADKGNPNKATLYAKLARYKEDFSGYKNELDIPTIDCKKLVDFLVRDCNEDKKQLVDKTSFIIRYLFSCLVDADSTDSANFDNNTARRLNADFDKCLEIIDNKLNSFVHTTELQKARHLIQQQVFNKVDEDAEIYLMNTPTGSGKTFCSLKFALERIKRKNYEKIIIISPYNSIIDQTASVSTKLFGDSAEILQHQSTVCYEDICKDKDFVRAAQAGIENWDAPFIITTMVQFFETLYGNKRRQLRKMHNMANSVIIIDEAHQLPKDYLQPCIQGLAYITRYLNSEVILSTATMPDFENIIKEFSFKDSKILNLVCDKTHFTEFKKCNFVNMGVVKINDLVKKASESPSSLIVLNSRKAARRVFAKCRGEKYHLSTYMTPRDRKAHLKKIAKSLEQLEIDFPDGNVPPERRIVIVSTSLIEAGVDLDVHTAFRELAGLENILQTAGRQNREGKRPISAMYIFELEDFKRFDDEKTNLTRGILEKYQDISCPEAIAEYYEQLFILQRSDNEKNTMSKMTTDVFTIPFKEYAEQFEIIESSQISIVIPQEPKVFSILKECEQGELKNIRKLQEYMCSVYPKELDGLLEKGVIKIYNPGIYCLTNSDVYYDKEIGILTQN